MLRVVRALRVDLCICDPQFIVATVRIILRLTRFALT
jgi:hypothetical protein